MPYAIPDHYSHGDRVTAASLNKLSDSVEFLYDRTGGVDLNFGVPFISGVHSYLFTHRYRWLWYRGNGYMELLGGLYRTSLSSGTAWAISLDLNSLSWLAYSDLYVVSGVSWAIEDPNA